MKLKSDEGGAVVFVAVELWRVHGEDREVIMVRRVALGRAGAAVAGNAKISAALHRALRRGRALGKAGYVWRDVEDDPVPETAAGRRVGIVNRERKALRALWRPGPRQGGRDIAARAAKAAEDLLVR